MGIYYPEFEDLKAELQRGLLTSETHSQHDGRARNRTCALRTLPALARQRLAGTLTLECPALSERPVSLGVALGL